MKIAIIGCGYVGSALALKLKEAGHYITATTRSLSKIPFLKSLADDVVTLQGNDLNSLTHLLRDQEAAILTIAADSQDSYESTYLQTAKNFTKAVSQARQLSQIIYTSSASVYGDHQGQIVHEETPLSTKLPTGHILIETEKILLNLSSKERQVCILRLGEIYGPGRQIVDRLRQMNGKPLSGDGCSMTNLIHLEDIVNGINHALTKPLKGTFNLCNDTHILRKRLYAQICTDEGIAPVYWDPSKPNIHAGNKLVSNNKIKSTGFHFTHAEF